MVVRHFTVKQRASRNTWYTCRRVLKGLSWVDGTTGRIDMVRGTVHLLQEIYGIMYMSLRKYKYTFVGIAKNRITWPSEDIWLGGPP